MTTEAKSDTEASVLEQPVDGISRPNVILPKPVRVKYPGEESGSQRSPQRSPPRGTPRGSTHHTETLRRAESKGLHHSNSFRPPEFKQKYNHTSLMFLTLQNPVRVALIRLLEWKWFDRFILFVILLNTCCLAAYDPLDTSDVHPESRKRDMLEKASLAFTSVFMFECAVKIVALGFVVGKDTYLHNGWNWLDFFIVLISILDYLPQISTGNLGALRTMRVMRPLRAITRFSELKFLVKLLIGCIPMLLNVLGLCAFIFFVFGILGVQLWAGVLKQRCYDTGTGLLVDPNFICGGFHQCADGQVCLGLNSSPNSDTTHFDHIGAALLTIFQCMTYEDWSVTMYYLQDGYSYWVIFYFITLLFLGPMFAIQLFLVVITTQYGTSSKQKKALEDAGFIESKPVPFKTKIRRYFYLLYRRFLRQRSPSIVGMGTLTATNAFATSPNPGSGSPSQSAFGATTLPVTPPKAWRILLDKFRSPFIAMTASPRLVNVIMSVIVVNTLFMGIDHDCDVEIAESYCKDFQMTLGFANICFTLIFGLEMVIKLIGLGPVTYLSDTSNLFDFVIVTTSFIELPSVYSQSICFQNNSGMDALACDGGSSGLSVLRAFRLVRIVKLLRAFPSMQRQMSIVVDSLSAVAWLCLLIVLFLFIFAVLGMNIFGGAVYVAISDLYLGCRVVLQVPGVTPLVHGSIETILSNSYQFRYGVRALFAFDSPSPYATADSSPPLLWADVSGAGSEGIQIIGMVPRANFDTLLFALVTVFQILTQENWDQVLYTVTPFSGMWSSAYFIIQIVIGNYMLLNLFVAIIIQGFADNADSVIVEKGTIPFRARLRAYFLKLRSTFETFYRVKAVDVDKAAFRSNRVAPVASMSRPASREDILQTGDSTVSLRRPSQPFFNPGTLSVPEHSERTWETDSNVSQLDSAAGVGSKDSGFPSAPSAPSAPSIAEEEDPEVEAGNGRESRAMTSVPAASSSRFEPLPPIFTKQPPAPIYIADNNRDERPASRISSFRRHPTPPSGAVASAIDGTSTPSPSGSISRGLTPSSSSVGRRATTPSVTSSKRASQNAVFETLNSHATRHILQGNTFWFLTPESRIRKNLSKIVFSKTFDNFILLIILLSCIALALERPAVSGKERVFLDDLNLALGLIFLVELILKCIVQSCTVYISSGWNRLDAFIVVATVIDFIASASGSSSGALKILRVFRIFRALRPLRVISRAEGLRIVVSTITGSIGPVLNTVVMALVIFFIFGILGVQLFGGKMRRCTDTLVSTKAECVGIADDGTAREWLNTKIHYDHIGASMLAMFILATQDNWPDQMWRVVDATSKNNGPIQNYNLPVVIFFVSFVLIGTFFILNIFIGVFVDNFNSASQEIRRRIEAENLRAAAAAARPTESPLSPGSSSSFGPKPLWAETNIPPSRPVSRGSIPR